MPQTQPKVKGVDRATRRAARCRARSLRHAQTWDGIGDEEILDRDAWRCQIPKCQYRSRKIDRQYKFPDPRSKAIDHIVPLSLGGDDTSANKRAAHHGCNMARGNRMGDEQLPLFGSLREAPLQSGIGGVGRSPLVCECGKPLRGAQGRCRACRNAEKVALLAATRAASEAAAQQRAERSRHQAEERARLHAEIWRLRGRGFAHRPIAEYLGTSQRTVCRVLNADPITGELPR